MELAPGARARDVAVSRWQPRPVPIRASPRRSKMSPCPLRGDAPTRSMLGAPAPAATCLAKPPPGGEDAVTPRFESIPGVYRRHQPAVLPQGRRLPVGLSGPHERPRVHPADRAGSVYRRLHAEPGVERLPRDPGPDLRPSLRAGLPARARGRQAGRHLPAEARRRRPARRHQRPPSRHPDGTNGKRVALVGAGPASLTVCNDLLPVRLRVRDLREERARRRPDAHQHPVVPPAGARARRGSRHHPRHGRRHPLQHAGGQPARAARPRGSTPSSSAAAPPRGRSWTSRGATTPTGSTSASSGSPTCTSATSTGSASAC